MFAVTLNRLHLCFDSVLNRFVCIEPSVQDSCLNNSSSASTGSEGSAFKAVPGAREQSWARTCLFSPENMGHSADDTRASQIHVCQLVLLLWAVACPASEFPWQGMVHVSWSPTKQSLCASYQVKSQTERDFWKSPPWQPARSLGHAVEGSGVSSSVVLLLHYQWWHSLNLVTESSNVVHVQQPLFQGDTRTEKKKKKKKGMQFRYCIQSCILHGKFMSIKGLQTVC